MTNRIATSPGLWSVIKSVLAAFFGVQSDKNRSRDFETGKPHHYIIIGVVMTVILMLTVAIVVNQVLPD